MNYFISLFLIGNILILVIMLGVFYYNGVSISFLIFVDDFYNVINLYQIQFYSNYGMLMINNFFVCDIIVGQKVIICVYFGLNKVYSELFDFILNDFFREYIYCYSWMFFNGNISVLEYNDYYYFFLIN